MYRFVGGLLLVFLIGFIVYLVMISLGYSYYVVSVNLGKVPGMDSAVYLLGLSAFGFLVALLIALFIHVKKR